MRTLYFGLTGQDVLIWEYFLLGINPTSGIIADGNFDQVTLDETKKFQKASGLTADGVVGPATMGKAMSLGFNPLTDDRSSEDGPNWPQAPLENPLSSKGRISLFGNFNFIPAPTPSNPEGITITDSWASNNIILISVPQLNKVVKDGKISIHRLIKDQTISFFQELENNGLSNKILTWGGSWVPRYIRGSRTNLSNHSWGTAFDINVQWNMLGTQPALKGQKGSVRELVEIANRNGFYWGGHFKERHDGMHFEAYKII